MSHLQWNTILTAEEIQSYEQNLERIDPLFARAQREYYREASFNQLSIAADRAFQCNDLDGYVLARSYRANKEHTRRTINCTRLTQTQLGA